jgi:formyltetrahydrofolate hydrolase
LTRFSVKNRNLTHIFTIHKFNCLYRLAALRWLKPAINIHHQYSPAFRGVSAILEGKIRLLKLAL